MADSTSNIQASGGDYTSFQAWFDAKDSVTGTHTALAADESFAGQLLANNGSAVASAWIVKPQSGAKHNGTSRNVSGSGAEMTHASQVIWWFNSNGGDLTVEDMVLEQTATSNAVIQGDVASITYVLTRLVCEKRGTSTNTNIDMNVASTVTVQDCVVYGHSTWGIDTRTATTNDVVHNTVIGGIGSGDFGILPANTGTVANNISVGHSSEDYFGTGADASHGANIAEDATAVTEWDGAGGGVNSVEVLETGETPTKDYVAFVDKDTAGSEDFHLVDLEHGTHSNVALAGGIASEGSGTDIDGDTRDGSTPDIGADEFAAAAGATDGVAQLIFLTGEI